MNNNIILDTDSYKASHWLQYPPETRGMYSYLESRGGAYEKTIFFGLQYYLKRYLTHRVTLEMVAEAEDFFARHGEPFNAKGWRRIACELEGRLPVAIHAVPEGTVVPTQNILMAVESTDPETFWVVSWLETLLLRLWFPITVATRGFYIRQRIYKSLMETAEAPQEEILFKLHDFGSRGTSSQESAAIGGAAHLVNFRGSDTAIGVRCANLFYHEAMAGFSIPAAEHSTVTAWGPEREEEAYRHILKQFAKPGAMVAVVSDSYNLWTALDKLWGENLKEEVINSGAVVVIRPDSGDPATVVLSVLQRLESKFGVTLNSKGYKILNTVRVIQGDGVDENTIDKILRLINNAGYSTTNLAFGMGGALLQQLNRDTLKIAYKCSEITTETGSVPVQKNPITDPLKRSRSGRLQLYRQGDWLITGGVDQVNLGEPLLRCVYKNGEILHETTLDDVRHLVYGESR